MALHSDRKMERAMATIRTQGDDGGETENGVRDTNTRDTDTYSSLKIESNYRQGAKRKMRRGEKEGMRSEVVMSVMCCGGRNHRHEVPKEGAKIMKN